jgi:hypothetical protein
MRKADMQPTEYIFISHGVRSLRLNREAGVTCSVKVKRVHLPFGEGRYDAMHHQSYACDECGQNMGNKERIMGGNSKNSPCNSKCMSATGPACDCWCNGAQHGSSHV